MTRISVSGAGSPSPGRSNEEAFFYINEEASIPQIGKAGAGEIVQLLRGAKDRGLPANAELKACLDNIREISILPAREILVTKGEKKGKGDPQEEEVKISGMAPARVKLVLARVDQGLFQSLSTLLGSDYFSSFKGQKFLRFSPPIAEDKQIQYANEILPSTEHNPVILFKLQAQCNISMMDIPSMPMM